MKNIYLLCLLTTFVLLTAVSRDSRLHSNASLKHTNNKEQLLKDFSSSFLEPELTAGSQLVPPVQLSVYKKLLFQSVLNTWHTLTNLRASSNYYGGVLAIISATSYKLLFPFHHFW